MYSNIEIKLDAQICAHKKIIPLKLLSRGPVHLLFVTHCYRKIPFSLWQGALQEKTGKSGQ